MKSKHTLWCFAPFFLLFSSEVWAQEAIDEQDGLGLAVKEIITDKGRWKLELGTSYSAISNDSNIGYYETIRTGDGGFIEVPVAIGESQFEKDIIATSLVARYGLTDKTELYSKVYFLYSNERIVDGITENISHLTGEGFSALTLGINHRFREDNEKIGIVGFADITLAEDVNFSEKQIEYGKSATVGLTSYKTFDPVVLSLTAGWRPEFSRKIGNDEINPGDTFFFEPRIAFAANNEITLTGGVSMLFTGADDINGSEYGVRTTRGDLEFGVAYSFDEDTTLQFNTTSDVIGGSSFTLGFSWAKTF